MNPLDFINNCKSMGILLEANGSHLRINAPKGVLTPALKLVLSESKGEILEVLCARTHPDANQASGGLWTGPGESRGEVTGVGPEGEDYRGVADSPSPPQVGVATPSAGPAASEQQAVSDAKGQALEERLAIMEYDGGLSREEAERWAADKPQFATRAFLYSVIREGRVERGTLVSQDIRTEPAATQHLRQRFPWLKVQWVQLITHPVCSGCQHYTGGVLCNADRSPEHVVKVGRCGRYEAASSVSEVRP